MAAPENVLSLGNIMSGITHCLQNMQCADEEKFVEYNDCFLFIEEDGQYYPLHSAHTRVMNVNGKKMCLINLNKNVIDPVQLQIDLLEKNIDFKVDENTGAITYDNI